MGGEWKKLRWGDLATLEYGKALRGYQKAEGSYRVFGTNGPIGWHEKPLCRFPSVIVGRKGAYRGIHFSPAPFFVIDTAFYLKPKKDLNIKWAYYELLNHDINNMDSGSAIPSTSRDSFYKLPVLVPPKSEQDSIAHILGSLDDKIELNRQMNETMEAMARAIFKSWFVDFDPVRAKAEGRDTGLPEEIAALFPDGFEDSKNGDIPHGWNVLPLSEVISITGGGTPKTKLQEYWGGDIPWFSVVDAPSETDIFVIDTEKYITQLGVKNSSAKVLRRGTTIISARGTVGKCALVGRPMAMNQSCYGIQGKHGISDYFVYYTLRRQVADLQRSGHGSVFNTITRETFKTIRIACPPANLTTSFDKTINPLMESVLANIKENETIVSLHDILLPKLISGELRVPDAEKFIEEAGV